MSNDERGEEKARGQGRRKAETRANESTEFRNLESIYYILTKWK